MDVAYINPFIAATRHVFDTMIHVPLILGTPHLKERSHPGQRITAGITLSGPVTGAVILGFPERLALVLASGFTGTVCKTLDGDVLDALGEIANMIAGNAKKDFPEDTVRISTPNVTAPQSAVYPPNTPVIVIPCVTANGNMTIEVALKTPARTPTPAAA